ncbi:hypothetical protein BU24DRAFT_423177 [Aaosphaeria arxii CBS 175.79]|uniref:BTB domain-containing protein n=1 Tax=Aaosphaeria arxii CBS 175.79 TaxID=1450172 RepID=A0A6A5XP70_9PLEO|nr:uncharacterized protein BU24DRAFT_423177 [Aaosphaeria arxii CBS 175.79]KAF2014144.1 hypothetical protein BU24DRAFT_423177 [Aaosphaeria arxii CBS 175.79]
MGDWQDRIVYYRDFAYTARRLRMANGNIGDVPASSYAELLSGPMIDIYVGESKRHWALHRNLLCHHSETLEAELQSSGKKQKDKLELPDHDPAGFELLVKWLYQGRLDDVSDLIDANQKYEYAVSCHKLYLLCERFDMPQLKNVAIDQYRKGLNEAELVPDAEEINEIYRKSPSGSPFRTLMTKIAARQIMDPESHRDVGTYRDCFVDNPEFAIDLVNAIKQGTGGMLFVDPTDAGNECEYHDHDAGPNCHIKGKGKTKQALKAKAPLHDPNSTKSELSINSVPRALPHRPPRLIPNPQPPARRQARLQDGTSVGPLRRRLTSPASSTVGTTTEHAMAKPLSPTDQKDQPLKAPLPEERLPDPAQEESHPVHDDHLPNSERNSLQPPNNTKDERNAPIEANQDTTSTITDDSSNRRGIWDWARAGTGRLNLIGYIPHPEWKGQPVMVTSKTATDAVNGVLQRKSSNSPHDDFSVPSTTSTGTNGGQSNDEILVAKMEGLGISSASVDEALFSQTKDSSDDLVAAASSINGTPSPKTSKSDASTIRGDFGSPPGTPSPPSRKQTQNGGADAASSPHRIPKYKIALASNLLSSPRKAVS